MANSPANEFFIVSRPCRFLVLIWSILSGMLYAASLPPFNWGAAVIFAFPVLFFAAEFYTWKRRFLCGFLWGCAWAFFSCRFLREIHPAIPFMLMFVLALWPGVFTVLLGGYLRYTDRQLKDHPRLKEAVKLLFFAALFTVVEWTRYRLFVWNDMSVTVWKLPLVMQIARFTGRYGITFLLALTGGALFTMRKKRYAIPALAEVLAVWVIVAGYGFFRLHTPEKLNDPLTLRAALIQGNMPQMRRAEDYATAMAIKTYSEMTEKLLKHNSADLVMWPECAVPVPLRSASPLGALFRQKVAALPPVSLLIGTLDFPLDNSPGMTNSALLLNEKKIFTGKYDKFHRVPFGEYVPGRTFLPEFLIDAFDMGRDLTAGKQLNVLNVAPGVRMGTAICYEGVFSYVTAQFARNRANVLAALSNDVWYPESSEPEQHLANAVMRAVETGLPMIRCGNNGGSGVVTPAGKFTRYIGTKCKNPELLREKAAGIVEVVIDREPEQTPFVIFGNWLPALCLILTGSTAIAMFAGYSRKKYLFRN